MAFIVIGAIVFVERGHRRIVVQYAKRVVGRRQYGGASTHIPLKVNTGGVIPVIFASSIIAFPQTVASFFQAKNPWMQNVSEQLTWGMPLYNLLYVSFIIFFCYFYTSIVFNPFARNCALSRARSPDISFCSASLVSRACLFNNVPTCRCCAVGA